MIAPLAVLVLLLAALTFGLMSRGGSRFSTLEFYAKCREGGFSGGEARKLREAAVAAKVADPSNLFWSPRDLDRVIASLIGIAGAAPRSREAARFMDKVYAIRKKIEFEQPRYKLGIRSSRQLAQGQRLRILVQGLGVLNSTVVDNNGRFLVASYPAGVRVPKGFVWKGKRVSVYFWRRDDAGYVFDTYILEDLRIRNVPVLHVGHSESLLRTQKRKSVRARSSIPAYLYLLKRIEGAFEKAEREPGLRCMIQDLSEDGFSLAIGGKARVGLRVKAQFSLGERQIVMSGTVRSIDWDSDKGRSVLHVEAVPPSPRTRNALRSYVYNIRAGEDDERRAPQSTGPGPGATG